MPRNDLPIAVDRAYTLWVWLDGRLVDSRSLLSPADGFVTPTSTSRQRRDFGDGLRATFAH